MTDNSDDVVLLETSLVADLGTEKIAMQEVELSLRQIGVPVDRIDDFKTMTAEGCLNAIEHGYGFDANQRYELMLIQSGREIILRVRDRGRTGGAPARYVKGNWMNDYGEPRGWGLVIIDALSDSWTLKCDGGITELEVRVEIWICGGGSTVV